MTKKKITPPGRGGSRPGAGRPRKGDKCRVGLSFSVDPDTKRKAAELRAAGASLNTEVEQLVGRLYALYEVRAARR